MPQGIRSPSVQATTPYGIKPSFYSQWAPSIYYFVSGVFTKYMATSVPYVADPRFALRLKRLIGAHAVIPNIFGAFGLQMDKLPGEGIGAYA